MAGSMEACAELPPPPRDIGPAVARRAVAWLIELQSGDVDEDRRRRWQHWLAAHPDHERAWQHIEAVNARLGESLLSGSASVARTTLAGGGYSRRHVLKVLSLLTVAGGAGWVARDPVRAWGADLRTEVGARRHTRLDDGTELTLNTNTAVDIGFSATERRLYLLRGEVLIATGTDARPFVVDIMQGEVRPLGTRFSVRSEQKNFCRVAVFAGAVEIHPRVADVPTLLRAGQQLDFSTATAGIINSASEDRVAWRDGLIVASSMRLDDFLVELGRYRPGFLRCDPAIADLRLSGTYPLDDTDRVLDVLCNTLGLRIDRVTRYWVTLRPENV